MVAHCVVRAGNSRMVAVGDVFLAKPNVGQTPERPSFGWKYAFEQYIVESELRSNLRNVLHTLRRLSDAYGRVWWGQKALAEHAGCCVRNLRRLLPRLRKFGYLRAEKMTFASLTAAQKELGLPVPDRSDDGRAPDLLTLLVKGEPACEMEYAQRRSSKRWSANTQSSANNQDKPGQNEPPAGVGMASPGQFVQGEPRPFCPDTPPDKMADDLSGSALNTRKVEGDLTRATPPSLVVDGEDQKIEAPPSNLLQPNASVDVEAEAWGALNTAYDTHYRRKYHARPNNKLVSRDCKQALSTCLVDYTELFVERLRERGVDVETLEAKPVDMLANEALRAWFDKVGTNGYLRRVSHRMRELHADFPYLARKAIEVLLERHAPKPEPKRAPAPVVALVSVTMGRNERKVSQDKPLVKTPEARVSPLKMPVIHSMHTLLMSRPSTRDFGSNVPLATALANSERGDPPERMVTQLDEPIEKIPRMESSLKVATTNEIHGVAIDAGGGVES